MKTADLFSRRSFTDQPDESKAGRHYLLFCMLILLMTAFQGCASTDVTTEPTTVPPFDPAAFPEPRDETRINAGDQIEVSVWGYDEFYTERTVSSQGYIIIPLVGEVPARGLTKEEFSDNLREELSEYIPGDINLTVSVISSSNQMVSVFGSVGVPDNYEIMDQATLIEILSRAGGTTIEADLRNITIYRETGYNNPIHVDLTRYLRGEEHPSNITPVMPGDIVYVPRQENLVREMSEFMRDVVFLLGMFRIFN